MKKGVYPAGYLETTASVLTQYKWAPEKNWNRNAILFTTSSSSRNNCLDFIKSVQFK